MALLSQVTAETRGTTVTGKTLPPKAIRRVYLVYKRSVYQKYVLDEKDRSAKAFLRGKNRSIRPMKKIHEAHYAFIREIENYIKNQGVEFETGFRHNTNDFKDHELIITVGGDGTFLRTAHHLTQNQMIMGINSLTTVSVGALCSATHKNYRKKLKEIFAGKYKIRELPLIKIRINGKVVKMEAVNDVLFTNISPAATSRYLIVSGGIREEHKSSGVWIATATGSTAVINAAGGFKVPREDQRLQFVIREPYQGIYNPYRLTRGFVNKNKDLTIINKMFDARIFIDGPTTSYRINIGDEVSFELSKRRLKVIA